ncbi:Uncharacterised protein [Mycobacteroides abscessus subsp. abscessus]|nr:Uncharacterised protein [Mycobacteroides abscessus subsp. abscessus]
MKTCPTLLAGSVLTSSTRLPWLARWTAVAQATVVLPTPPLPVKKKCRGGFCRKAVITGSFGVLGSGVVVRVAVSSSRRRQSRSRPRSSRW